MYNCNAGTTQGGENAGKEAVHDWCSGIHQRSLVRYSQEGGDSRTLAEHTFTKCFQERETTD